MVDVLERLRRFLEIAVAEGANDNEARNAAMHVCRLIKQHGIKLSLGQKARKDADQDQRDIDFLRKNATRMTEDFFEVFMQDVQREAEMRSRGYARPPPQPHVADPPPRRGRTADPDVKVITVNFPTSCVFCKQPIWNGVLAYLSRGDAFHRHCWSLVDE